jgi:hypothetical protein
MICWIGSVFCAQRGLDVSFAFTEMDQLVIERWSDVVGLIEAHRETQDRIQEMIDVVGERVARWARPLGFEVQTFAKEPEFQAWRPSWADRRKGARVQLALGGFCPLGYRKLDVKHPYLWVYTSDLESFKIKEAERIQFSHSLRTALGGDAKAWEAEGTDDADGPLGRYLTVIADSERARHIASPDALFEFVTANYPTVFALADVIDAELTKLGR